MQRLLFILFLLSSTGAAAQERQRLAGYVQMPGNPLVSYYLELTIKDNRVSGYSVTDYTGGNRLKASVKGRIGPASEMHIEETGSLDGPTAAGTTYCYFKASLKLSVSNGKQRWAGPFESRLADGSPCNPFSGFMTVLDNAPPLDPPKAVAPSGMRVKEDPPRPVAPPSKPVPKAVAPKPVQPAPKPQPPKDTVKPLVREDPPKPKPRPAILAVPAAPVKPAAAPPVDTLCTRRFEWASDSLSFDVWDGWTIDGDVISLSLEGRTLLDHAKLNENRQHFTLTLAPGLNILSIFLHDEGFEKPNTPNMILYDGDKRHQLNISGNPGETARICISRSR